MSLSLSPPPLQVPIDFSLDKQKAAFFSTLLNTIYKLWNAVYSFRFNARVKTTNATITAGARIEVPLNKTVMVDSCIVARRTGGTSGTNGDSAWYRLTGAYKNIAGTLTGIGSPSLIGGEDQAGWNVGFTNSGTSIVITVLGATNNDITWEITFSAYTVGA